MAEFFPELGNPACHHLLLNHLPIVDLAAGALGLFIAFFSGAAAPRSRG